MVTSFPRFPLTSLEGSVQEPLAPATPAGSQIFAAGTATSTGNSRVVSRTFLQSCMGCFRLDNLLNAQVNSACFSDTDSRTIGFESSLAGRPEWLPCGPIVTHGYRHPGSDNGSNEP